MNKKRNLILSILGIVGLVLITAGVTYAFFNYAKEGTTENSVTTGTITFLYTEVDQVGAGISIEDAVPTSDAVGKALTGEGNVFNFKVTANTKGKASIPYEITARKKNTSTLDESAVRVYLTEIDGTEKELLLDNYSNLTQTTKIDPTVAVEKTIYTGKVSSNTENYEKNFRLRMWVPENIDYSEGEYNAKTFTLTVNVYANATVVTDSEIAEEGKAEITNVKVGDTELVKIEDQSYQYEASLPIGTTSTVIEVATESPNATVDIERVSSLENINNNKIYSVKKIAVTKALTLIPGDNLFKVTVTSENGKAKNMFGIKISVARTVSLLKDDILATNTLITASPTLNKSSNYTTDTPGLYSSTDTNSGNPTYYFRGNVTNNYVSFAGLTWRIVRINEDGTIRLISSTSVLESAYYPTAWNTNYIYTYYSNSKVKELIDSWYQTNLSNYDSKIASIDYCEKISVTQSLEFAAGNAILTAYNNYTPTFKCEADGNNHGVMNMKAGLMNYDEFVYAGGYPFSPNNQFYLYSNEVDSWLMSAMGRNANNSTCYGWAISTKNMNSLTINNGKPIRPVINLNSDTLVSGNGTIEEPYIVK